MKIPLLTRFKLAWSAFCLKEFHERIAPLHQVDTLEEEKDNVCDNNRRIPLCTNQATVCISSTHIVMQIRINEDDHYHVCHACAHKSILNDQTEDFK